MPNTAGDTHLTWLFRRPTSTVACAWWSPPCRRAIRATPFHGGSWESAWHASFHRRTALGATGPPSVCSAGTTTHAPNFAHAFHLDLACKLQRFRLYVAAVVDDDSRFCCTLVALVNKLPISIYLHVPAYLRPTKKAPRGVRFVGDQYDTRCSIRPPSAKSAAPASSPNPTPAMVECTPSLKGRTPGACRRRPAAGRRWPGGRRALRAEKQ